MMNSVMTTTKRTTRGLLFLSLFLSSFFIGCVNSAEELNNVETLQQNLINEVSTFLDQLELAGISLSSLNNDHTTIIAPSNIAYEALLTESEEDDDDPRFRTYSQQLEYYYIQFRELHLWHLLVDDIPLSIEDIFDGQRSSLENKIGNMTIDQSLRALDGVSIDTNFRITNIETNQPGIVHVTDEMIFPPYLGMDLISNLLNGRPSWNFAFATMANLALWAGLEEDLNRVYENGLTFLCPTNRAFNLAEIDIPMLLTEGMKNYTKLFVQSHMIDSQIYGQASILSTIDDETNTTQIVETTVAGTSILITADDFYGTLFQSIDVAVFDQATAYSLVHGINYPLFPPMVSDFVRITSSLVTSWGTSRCDEILSNTLLSSSDILASTTNASGITLWCPTNNAFGQFSTFAFAYLTEPIFARHATEFILNHMNEGPFSRQEIVEQVQQDQSSSESSFITMLNGATYGLDVVESNEATVQSSPIILSSFGEQARSDFGDLIGIDGYMHVLDAVLTPTAVSHSIFDRLESDLDFTEFVNQIQFVDLQDLVDRDIPLTVLAPYNNAWNRGIELDALEIEEVVKRHIFRGLLFLDVIVNTTQITTVDGLTLPVELRGPNKEDIFVDNAYVYKGDILANNGVLHHIDRIIGEVFPTSAPTISPVPTVTAFPTSSVTPVPTPIGGDTTLWPSQQMNSESLTPDGGGGSSAWPSQQMDSGSLAPDSGGESLWPSQRSLAPGTDTPFTDSPMPATGGWGGGWGGGSFWPSQTTFPEDSLWPSMGPNNQDPTTEFPLPDEIIFTADADTYIYESGELAFESFGTEDTLVVQNNTFVLISFNVMELSDLDNIFNHGNKTAILELAHLQNNNGGNSTNLLFSRLASTPLDIEMLHSGLFVPSDALTGPIAEVASTDILLQVDLSDFLFGQTPFSRTVESQLLIMIESLHEDTIDVFQSRESFTPPKLRVVIGDGESGFGETFSPSPSEGPTPVPTPASQVPSILVPTATSEPTPVESSNNTMTSLEPSTESLMPTAPSAIGANNTSPPSNITVKVCSAARNETSCSGDGVCYWCQDNDDENSSVCRSSQEECPGQGRGNPCSGLIGAECETNGCLWCEEQETCTSSRGHDTHCPANITAVGSDSDCPSFLSEGNCTSNLACRWCSGDNLCQKSQFSCSNGTLGVLGNPCKDAESEASCPGECLWCTAMSECQKPAERECFQSVAVYDNCQLLDVAPECNATEDCKWCEAQSRCEFSNATCGVQRGEVGIEFDNDSMTAGFVLQDDGLGSTDNDAVSVSLEYLFEVADDGTTVPGSLVDFAFEEFSITQSIGGFSVSSDDVLARKINFEATIEGVGNINMDVFIFLNGGAAITEAGESWSVKNGDVKFNLRMSDWSFCDAIANPCGGGGVSPVSSEFVDVAIRIEGSDEVPDPSDTSALLFNLGGNVPLTLSDKVMLDDSLESMPEGFPRAESTEGEGTVFVLRFPKFDNVAEYDPIIGFSEALIDVADDTPTPAPVNAGVSPTESPVAISTTAPVSAIVSSPDPSAGPSVSPTNATQKEDDDPDDDDGLSVGAIIGIVVGGILGLCCCCAFVGMMMKSKEEREDENQNDSPLLNGGYENDDDDLQEKGMYGNTADGDDDNDSDEDEDDDEESYDEDDSDEDDEDDDDESDDDEQESYDDEDESAESE